MALAGNPADWSSKDRQGVIFDALAAQGAHVHIKGTERTESGKSRRKCPTCRAAARELFDAVGVEPLIYKSGGEVLPKGKPRWERFMNNVGEIHAYMVAQDWLNEPSEAPSEPSEAPEAPEEAPASSDAPVPSGAIWDVRSTVPADLSARAERFYSEVQKRRAFVRGRKGMESLDSMRVIIEGVKALKLGLPVEALISAIEAPWTAETRAQAAAYRPSREDLKPRIPEGTYDYGAYAPRPSKFAHCTSEYVARLVAANVPVWLHGPAGTGKSSAARYGAKQAGLAYYEVNLSGAMVSAIKGKDRLKEFVESEAMEAFEKGGLLCLEEFSGAHPSVGTALNTMLALSVGEAFSNDAAGRKYVKHADFRVVVTDNSLGYGSAEFKRNALDAATLDRFRVGRVYQGLDLELERNIFNSILEAA